MSRENTIFLLLVILIAGILISIIIAQVNSEPNTCVIETRNEIITGRSCWQRAGCINYSKDGIDYTLCGDFKVYTKNKEKINERYYREI